ncbi:hypothetical protein J3B00_003553 [Pseudomonas sp. BP8]|nr:hypothetical protein [Pseudomonas sp. BP8]
MQEQAVFGYFFPRKKVTRRKGGRGHYSHYIKWISPQCQSKPSPADRSPQQSVKTPKKSPAGQRQRGKRLGEEPTKGVVETVAPNYLALATVSGCQPPPRAL